MKNKNNGLFQEFVLEFEAKDKLFKEYSSQFRARLITIEKDASELVGTMFYYGKIKILLKDLYLNAIRDELVKYEGVYSSDSFFILVVKIKNENINGLKDVERIFKEVFCKKDKHPEAQTKVNLSIDFFTDINGTTVEDNGNISKSINLLKKIEEKNE